MTAGRDPRFQTSMVAALPQMLLTMFALFAFQRGDGLMLTFCFALVAAISLAAVGYALTVRYPGWRIVALLFAVNPVLLLSLVVFTDPPVQA